MTTPPIQLFVAALKKAWAAETSFVPEEWTSDNPARGQCLVSALVTQDYYGGDLRRYRVTGEDLSETHYCNVLDNGTILDTTGSQYTSPVTLRVDPIELDGYASSRDKRLSNDKIRGQYEILKSRVEALLS
jgi:hypothetical protein